MFNLLLSLHVLFAVFVVGPLVFAATTAGRGVRTANADATASSARVLKIYANASLLVVVVGLGLMSLDSPDHKGEKVAKFTNTWIWLSVALWLVAMGIVHGVVVPALTKATGMIAKAEPVASLTARVGAAGGVVGVLFAAIVFLMVYRPDG